MILTALPALICSVIALFLRGYHRRRLNIPYATSNIPVVGVTLEFSHDPVKYLQHQRKIHGDVFCLDFLFFRLVVFASVAGNTALVRKPESELSMSIVMRERMGEKWAESLLYGDWEQIWHPTQTKNFNALTAASNLANMKPKLLEILKDKFFGLKRQGPFALFENISRLVSAVNVYIFLGEHLYDTHGNEISALIIRLEEHLASKALQVLPHAWHPHGWELRLIYSRPDEILLPELEYRKSFSDLRNDYLSQLIRHLGWDYTPIVSVHILFMLFAAHTNVARTFNWVVAHMLSTPEVYERVQASLRDDKYKYWEYCIRETGRCYTNLFLMRNIANRFRSRGYEGVRLTKGENVVISPLRVSRDKTLWEHADSWFPERFNSDTLAKHSKRSEYVQFGGGVHSCKGEKKAWWLMRSRFQVVDEKYEWESVVGIRRWERVEGPDAEDILEGGRRQLGTGGTGLEPLWLGKNLGRSQRNYKTWDAVPSGVPGI